MSPTPASLLPRLPGLLLIVAVLLGQFLLFEHEQEHTLSGDNEHCAICLLADHQAALHHAIALPLTPLRFEPIQPPLIHQADLLFTIPYSTRAPPVA